jgi:hypothetical protein
MSHWNDLDRGEREFYIQERQRVAEEENAVMYAALVAAGPTLTLDEECTIVMADFPAK